MGPFPVSNGYSYILLAVDYMTRWVEAVVTKTNDAKVVVNFLKSNIFCSLGVPKALISDQGSHFCNRAMSSLLEKYGVAHWIATTYHPQTNDQAKNTKLTRQSRSATWPTTKLGKKGSSNYKLEELHLEAYENSLIYKKEFHVGQKVLLFKSRLRLIVGKLRSKWEGPFIITKVLPYGAVELQNELTRSTFQANGQ
ncbi:Pro-Pol polyprotein, partial [Mucuna pruriens]